MYFSRLKRERFEERPSNNPVSSEERKKKELARYASRDEECRNSSRSSLMRGRLFSSANFIESYVGRGSPRTRCILLTLYTYVLFPIESLKSVRVNAVANTFLAPRDRAQCTYTPGVTTKGRFLPPASCISALSRLKRGSAARNDERTMIPRNRYGCEATRASLMFSLDMRETTRAICMHSGIHKSAAFNDTDAPRISAQETRSKFRCYSKSFSYSLNTITVYNQLEDTVYNQLDFFLRAINILFDR